MADDDEIKWKFSLDTEGFKSGAEEAGKALEQVGEAAELPIGSLKTLIETTSFVVAAYAAMKASISMIETAEETQAVNTQFDMLAKNAGVAGNEIKEKLIKSAAGLATDTEIIKAANQAMIGLGESSGRMPEIMELARKASALTGESLISTFNNLSHAIENGNQRALKHYGIYVDSTKAVSDFAKAHGVAADELSTEAQRQALVNGAIDAGNKSLKDVDPSLRQTTNTIEQFKTTLKEIGEVISVAFESIAGETVRNSLRTVNSMFSDLKDTLTAKFGKGAEQAAAQTKQLQFNLQQMQGQLVEMTSSNYADSFWDKWFGKDRTQRVAELQKNIDATKSKLEDLGKKEEEAKAKESAGVTPSDEETKKSLVNQDVIEKKNLKFHQDLLKLKEERLKSTEKLVQSEGDIEENLGQRIVNENEKFELQKQALKQNTKIRDGQDEKELEEMEKNHQLKMQELARETQQQRIKMEQDLLYNSNRVDDQIVISARLKANQAAEAWKKSGQLGGAAVTAFQTHAENAFMQIGEGSKSASEIMKGFMFGAIGDIAEAQGKFMLLDAFKTFPAVNFPELAAGGGLLVLAGYLHAQAGGGTSSVPDVGGGAASGGAVDTSQQSTTGNAATVGSAATDQQQAPQKTFQLVVNGNVFSNQETAQQVVQMFRDAADATNFKYTQIGNQ